MSRTTDFSHVTGIAKIEWRLTTETPLCIKSGTTSALTRDAGRIAFDDKSEGGGGKEESRVSDFYFDVRFEDIDPSDAPRVVFRIPASSVRGALRNYTIKRLVPKKLRAATLFGKPDDGVSDEQSIEEQSRMFKDALKQPGWHLVQNLFGMAADTGDDALEDETVAGRLRVWSDDVICRKADLDPPETSPLAVVSRSPLDRTTRGTKDGGLHSFMELSKGKTFNVRFQIVNPTPEDLGFIAFWENSINQGLVRMGGLVSVGKGRLRVKQASVRLFARTTDDFEMNDKIIKTKAKGTKKDLLADLFPEHHLKWEDLRGVYLKKLQIQYDQLGKGV